MLEYGQYKKYVKALGYGMRSTRYSEFIGVTYTKAGQALPIGKGLISAADNVAHKELQSLRMQHKGTVFNGLTRVVI